MKNLSATHFIAWMFSLDCNSQLSWLCTITGSQLCLYESHVQGPTCSIRDPPAAHTSPTAAAGPNSVTLLHICSSYPKLSPWALDLGLLWIRNTPMGCSQDMSPLTHLPRDHQPCHAPTGDRQGRANANPTVKWDSFRKSQPVPKDLMCCKSSSPFLHRSCRPALSF